MRLKWGAIIFVLSFLGWGGVFLVPLLDLGVAEGAALATGIYGFSYVLFFVSGWLLAGGQKPTIARTMEIGREITARALGRYIPRFAPTSEASSASGCDRS